jgi:carbohydrate-selective porin OprB
MPPKVTASSLGAVRTDRDTSFHIEAFYKYKVSNNLFITPGIVMITNPEHNSNNPTLYLGTIRTTFNF